MIRSVPQACRLSSGILMLSGLNNKRFFVLIFVCYEEKLVKPGVVEVMRKAVERHFDQDNEQQAYSIAERYLNRFEEVDEPGLNFSPTYFRNIFETATTYRNLVEDSGIENDLTKRIGENYRELLTSYASSRPAEFIESVLSMSDEEFEVDSGDGIEVSLPEYPTLQEGVEVEPHTNYGFNMKFVPGEDDGVKHLKNLVAIPVSDAFEEVLRPERFRRRTTEKDKPATMNMGGF